MISIARSNAARGGPERAAIQSSSSASDTCRNPASRLRPPCRNSHCWRMRAHISAHRGCWCCIMGTGRSKRRAPNHPLLAVLLSRRGEGLVVFLALRRRRQDRRIRGDRLVEEALLVGSGEPDLLAAVVGPDFLRAVDVLCGPDVGLLVGLARLLMHDLLEIRTERLHEVAVRERHGGGPVRRQ